MHIHGFTWHLSVVASITQIKSGCQGNWNDYGYRPVVWNTKSKVRSGKIYTNYGKIIIINSLMCVWNF